MWACGKSTSQSQFHLFPSLSLGTQPPSHFYLCSVFATTWFTSHLPKVQIWLALVLFWSNRVNWKKQTLDQPYRSHYTRKLELKAGYAPCYTLRKCNLVCVHIHTRMNNIHTEAWVHKYTHTSICEYIQIHPQRHTCTSRFPYFPNTLSPYTHTLTFHHKPIACNAI